MSLITNNKKRKIYSIASIEFAKKNFNLNLVIEKHVKMKGSKGPDAETSIDTDELAEMIHQLKIIKKMQL